MASRRNLKKQIHAIMDTFCHYCLERSLTVPDSEVKRCIEFMVEAQQTREEFISRISHTEPGNVKGFYKKLHADFKAKIEGYLTFLNELPTE